MCSTSSTARTGASARRRARRRSSCGNLGPDSDGAGRFPFNVLERRGRVRTSGPNYTKEPGGASRGCGRCAFPFSQIEFPALSIPTKGSPHGREHRAACHAYTTQSNQIRGFWAAWGGWALDGMDAFIYSLVLVPALTELLPRSGIPATPGNVGYYGSVLLALFLSAGACRWSGGRSPIVSAACAR